MSTDLLRKKVQGFDPTLPLERAWMPPSSWYTDADFYDFEKRNVFQANWLIAARTDQLESAGRYVCGEVAGERYVVVRGDDGQIRAFYNVCRHHAAAVVEGEGQVKRLSCPYHGWTYGLDGKLLNAPEFGDVADFDRECFGLAPMAVETWGPFVFISMTPPSRSLSGDLTVLKSELDDMDLGRLQFVKHREYSLRCNWKVFVDNYLDGGYHVAYLHRGLASQLDLASYRTRIFDRYSIQSGAGAMAAARQSHAAESTAIAGKTSHATDGTAAAGKKGRTGQGSDFAERIGDRVLYAWIYPNFMINRYGSIMDTNWVIPNGKDETVVIFDYYFIDAEKTKKKGFVERSIAASDVVQLEDAGICEAVQRGLESSSYDKGRYSPLREGGEYHFHKLLADDFARGLASR